MSLKRWLAASSLSLLAGGFVGSAIAGEAVEGKNNKVTYDGLVWATYSYTVEDASPQNERKDFNGFAIDRVYLTLTSQLGERYTARGRIEASNLNTGAAQIFLKSADIQVTDPFGAKGSKLRFGQTDGVITPWYEKMWAYRVVSKVTTDRYLGISSTYVGAGWAGRWADGLLESDLLVANRASFSNDVASGGADAKFKTFGARAYVHPIKEGSAKGLGLGGYAQYAPRVSPSSDNDDLWFGGHAFFEGGKFAVGAQYDSRRSKTAGKSMTAAVISGIGRYTLSDRDQIFARVDNVDFDKDHSDYTLVGGESPVSAIDKKLKQTVIMGGVSHAYSKTLRSILDLSVRSFQDKLYRSGAIPEEIKPDTEFIVTARLDAAL